MEYSAPRRPDFPAPRRVATAPMSLRSQFATPSDGIVETLYNHPNAKIISFTASGRAFSRSMERSAGFTTDEEPGTLSWSSQLERTIAVGPFRIYRAPGSVAFLNCGSALQPILPKSQCWCIDEVNSKFVLQIRRPNYWRIELPVLDPEDQQRAQDLRVVLDQILQFEKTECPFKRSFTVVLPEPPKTPVKKRPWTPVRHSLPATPFEEHASPSARSTPGTLRPSSAFFSERHDNSVAPQTSSADAEASVSQPYRNKDGSNPTAGKSSSFAWDAKATGSPIRRATTWVSSGECKQEQDITEASCPSELPGRNLSTSPSLDNPPPALQKKTSGRHPLVEVEQKGVDIPGPEADIQPIRKGPISEQPPASNEEVLMYELHEGSGNQGEQMKARLRRRGRFPSTRSFTSPPQLPPLAETTPKASNETVHTAMIDRDSAVLTPPPIKSGSMNDHGAIEPQIGRRGSEDSFHSVQSWHSPTGASPPCSPIARSESPSVFPYPHDDIRLPKCRGPSSHTAEEILVSETTNSWGAASDRGSEVSEESVATAPDVMALPDEDTPPKGALSDSGREGVRIPVHNRQVPQSHRTTTSSISVRRRALSPLPPAANLFSPTSTSERQQPYRSKLETVKRLPLTIIAKTCEILLGPPSHLMTLMLKVAAKIAAGEWRGLVYGYNENGEQIPVQWDYSEGEFSDWSDDEPYMGAHHGHGPTIDEEPAGETGDASDDSRSWGVD